MGSRTYLQILDFPYVRLLESSWVKKGCKYMICMGKNIGKWRKEMGWNGFFHRTWNPLVVWECFGFKPPKKDRDRCAPCDPRIWPRPGGPQGQQGPQGVEAGDLGEFSGNMGRFPIKNWRFYVEHGKIEVFFSSKICPKLAIDCWPMKN